MKMTRCKYFIILLLVNITGLLLIYYKLSTNPASVMRIRTVCASPTVSDADRLQVVFDRDIVKQDDIGTVEKQPLCSLKPALAGAWTWSAPDTLDYLLDKPLPPGRVFTLSATQELEHQTGRVLKGPERFEIQSEPLKYIKHEMVAIDRQNVTLKVIFNQSVDPDELLKSIHCKDQSYGRTLDDCQCLTQQPDKEMVVRFDYPYSDSFEMRIDKGLTGFQAELGLSEDVVIREEVKLAFSVFNADVERLELGEPVQIDVRFSDYLDETQIIKGVEIDPPIENLRISQCWSYLQLVGDFKPGQRYRITIPETVLSEDGQTLGKQASVNITVPDYRSNVAFKHAKGFLSPHGQMLLEMQAVNLETINVNAHQILPNNLVHYLHGTDLDTVSRVATDKTINLNLEHNQPQDVVLDLSTLVSERGVYRLDAINAENHWRRDHIVVAVTDLALTSKQVKDGYWVWVTSIITGKPVEDVVVKAFTYNNQLLASSETDERGMAALKYNSRQPDGAAWVIVAQKNDDLVYLQPKEWEWTPKKMAASSRDYAQNYEVLLYTDRGLYRPGDTIHATGIIRGGHGGTPPGFPLIVKVFRPDGVLAREISVPRRIKDQGMFHADYEIPEDGFMGQYRFRVQVAGEELSLGDTVATVEAFLPVRMEVDASSVLSWQGPNETPELEVKARYLWDEPCVDLPVSISGWIKPLTFRSETHPGYRFGHSGQGTQALESMKSHLDQTGKLQVPITIPDSLEKDLYQLNLSATVTEPGGRSVSDAAGTVVDQRNLHLGLSFPDGDLVKANAPFSVDWIRLTGRDELASPGAMIVHLKRIEYETVYKSVEGWPVWETVEKAVHDVNQFEIAGDSATDSFVLSCPEPGRYRLSIQDLSTEAKTVVEFDACNPLNTDWTVPTDRPEDLTITVDRERYNPGESLKVRVQSPIEGTLLLTLETDQVFYHKVVESAGKSNEIAIPLPEDLRGSFFVVASVVRAVDPGSTDWSPHRAMGSLQVLVDNSNRKLPVQLHVPVQAKPGEQMTCSVEMDASNDPNVPAFVHLWAVDEGILLAGHYQTPDPYQFFLGPRAWGVETADTFFQLLPDYQRPGSMSRIGAGEMLEERLQRHSPVPMRRRQAAVLWNQAVPLDPNGKARFDFILPDLIGQMRMMAVVVDGDRYSHIEQDVTLTQPLMAEAAWPRFASPGDTFEVPVKLFNATGQAMHVGMEYQCAGPLELAGQQNLESIEVLPERPTTVWLTAKATGIGPVDVNVIVESTDPNLKLNAKTEAKLAVRQATALHSETVLTQFSAGSEPLTYCLPETFIKDTTTTTVSVSGLPTVQLKTVLESLIQYPYGCVEQTSSQLRSLLYMDRILGQDQGKIAKPMIEAGIARLWGMQTRTGGLSYWPGSTKDYVWGTTYAAYGLIEATEFGYEVDRHFTKALCAYLDRQLRSNDDVDINTKALMCRVLVGFDLAPRGWMMRLAEQVESLDVAGQAHLAAAFHACGDRSKALFILPERLSETRVATRTHNRLTSQVAQEAVLLSVLLDVNSQHPLIPQLANRLTQAQSQDGWHSTLNNACCLSALCRYQIATQDQTQDFKGSIQTQGIEPVSFDHSKCVSTVFRDWEHPIIVASEGDGTLYLTITTEGQSAVRIDPYSRGLSVVRRWTDQDGNDIDLTKLSVGDLITSTITIQSNGREIHNIAIVDALCAGMEVENPNLATSTQRGSHATHRPDRAEFLDDRVLLFCSADSRPQTFEYALRVTTVGEFERAPIQASCMYDPDIACLGQAARVVVSGKGQ